MLVRYHAALTETSYRINGTSWDGHADVHNRVHGGENIVLFSGL